MNLGGLGVKRNLSTGSIPVWQGTEKDITLAQGGFLLDQTGISQDEVIPAGTPCVFNEATRAVVVLHTGIVQANAASNAVNYNLKKGSNLNVGDYLASGATGAKAYAITAIDTTNADYDIYTVGTTIGAVTAGDTVYASTATGATASALPAVNGRTYREVNGDAGVGVPVSVVIRGVAYARRMANSPAIEAALKANGALIIHSQSF